MLLSFAPKSCDNSGPKRPACCNTSIRGQKISIISSIAFWPPPERVIAHERACLSILVGFYGGNYYGIEGYNSVSAASLLKSNGLHLSQGPEDKPNDLNPGDCFAATGRPEISQSGAL